MKGCDSQVVCHLSPEEMDPSKHMCLIEKYFTETFIKLIYLYFNSITLKK